MKQDKEIRFDLIPFFEEQEQTQRLYVYKWQIENNGCYKIQLGTENVKVYTPQLAIILSSTELLVRNIETETQVTIKGLEYLKTYVKAYKEGQQYFESEYKVSPNIIYSPEAEQYVRDIHENFFHVQHSGVIEGWGYVKRNFNNILTHNNVQEFGYYSGIVSKVEELVKKYRLQFEKYEKCEHDSIILEQTETVKIKAPVLGLFCNLINKIGIDKRDETESATVYCERICVKFKLPFTDRVRQNYNVNENKKLIKELQENVLPLIDNEAKVLIENYFSNKQPPKQTLYV